MKSIILCHHPEYIELDVGKRIEALLAQGTARFEAITEDIPHGKPIRGEITPESVGVELEWEGDIYGPMGEFQ